MGSSGATKGGSWSENDSLTVDKAPNTFVPSTSSLESLLISALDNMSRTLVFVTGNKNKLAEVRHILESFNILVESQSLDIPEIQGNTQEVASSKCKRAAELIGGPCITEDTALCFHALNGLPGPYIKDFMEKMGHEGLNRLLDGFSTRGATAVCTFAYCPGPGMEPVLFEGKTEGTIVPARGSTHFGWDAVFQPSGTNLTYAEMEPNYKNTLSHRYKALNMLVGYLKHTTI